MGANYHRPVDLPDTTGLCWKEGIIRCLESVRTQSRTPPPTSSPVDPKSSSLAIPKPCPPAAPKSSLLFYWHIALFILRERLRLSFSSFSIGVHFVVYIFMPLLQKCIHIFSIFQEQLVIKWHHISKSAVHTIFRISWIVSGILLLYNSWICKNSIQSN